VSTELATPVDVSRSGGVGFVRLNVPDRRNAISLAMRAALADAFAALDRDDDVLVAVLTGVGTAFCAGVDLKEAPASDSPIASDADPVTAPLERFRKPLIAAINGPAVGGGFELALAADLRVASTAARFALPEVRLGSLPGSGGTQRLVRLVPPAIAGKLIFTGDSFDADAALACGLVSDVVDPGDLDTFAAELAARIAANAPLSLRAAKAAMRASLDDAMRPGLALERALFGMLASTFDREEGRAAFRERRPPQFEGR
jgi:enoyl-CoA hydratase/carnithine racemase